MMNSEITMLLRQEIPTLEVEVKGDKTSSRCLTGFNEFISLFIYKCHICGAHLK